MEVTEHLTPRTPSGQQFARTLDYHDEDCDFIARKPCNCGLPARILAIEAEAAKPTEARLRAIHNAADMMLGNSRHHPLRFVMVTAEAFADLIVQPLRALLAESHD